MNITLPPRIIKQPQRHLQSLTIDTNISESASNTVNDIAVALPPLHPNTHPSVNTKKHVSFSSYSSSSSSSFPASPTTPSSFDGLSKLMNGIGNGTPVNTPTMEGEFQFSCDQSPSPNAIMFDLPPVSTPVVEKGFFEYGGSTSPAMGSGTPHHVSTSL